MSVSVSVIRASAMSVSERGERECEERECGKCDECEECECDERE